MLGISRSSIPYMNDAITACDTCWSEMSDGFPNDPFDSIAHNGVTDPAGHGDPETDPGRSTADNKHIEKRIRETSALIVDFLVFG